MFFCPNRWVRRILVGRRGALFLAVVMVCLVQVGCGDGEAAEQEARSGAEHGATSRAKDGATRPGRGGASGRAGGGPGAARGGKRGMVNETTSIPVRVARLERRRVSDYLQTTGALEAENEVDIVARTSGPVVEMLTEEGRRVQKGQILATLDARELSADLELAKVSLIETKAAFDRAKRSFEEEIISAEAFDVTKARFETAKAQITTREIQLSYTEIRAPFSGRIIERVIKQGEHVSNGAKLFRISDFDPLLCPIYLPEKDLGRVSVGQEALVSVEAFPGETFAASVLRINPVINRVNGTFKVTLQAQGNRKLRPGMFASVFLEVAAHDNAMVVPKRALVLEGVGDTVYVYQDGVAERREVTLGFEEASHVEVIDGLQGDEEIIVLGQDSLTDGTPIYILERADQGSAGIPGDQAPAEATRRATRPTGEGASLENPSETAIKGVEGATPAVREQRHGPRPQGEPGSETRRRGRAGMAQIDWDDAKQVEQVKERLRSFGMSDQQIEQRLQVMRGRQQRLRSASEQPRESGGTPRPESSGPDSTSSEDAPSEDAAQDSGSPPSGLLPRPDNRALLE